MTLNQYKEIELLKNKIMEIRSVNYNLNNTFIDVTPYFYSMIASLEKIAFRYDTKDIYFI